MTDISYGGKPLGESQKIAILLHGRGASSASILALSDHLSLEEYSLIAPQASGGTWYPYSFMAPDEFNSAALDKAITLLDSVLDGLFEKGYSSEQLYLIGFSQGACLSLEYTALNAQRFGGVIAFTGGLIGEQFNPLKYQGNFEHAPIFIGCSYKDMHVPVQRVEESATLLKNLGANVKTMIFQDTLHTIRQEEVEWVNKNILE
jgi:phospholipase/carboxylesterase